MLAITDAVWDQVGNWTAVTFLGLSFLFLVHWLAKRTSDDLRILSSSIISLQITQVELFKLLIKHDAHVHYLIPKPNPEDRDEHYAKAEESLASVTDSLDEIQRRLGEQESAIRRSASAHRFLGS